MRLHRVTITGADDSIDPSELVGLSNAFPFVEWGILFSRKRIGPRFPSLSWLTRLQEMSTPGMQLSAHLCGGWVRDFVIDGQFTWGLHEWVTLFNRVQLNFHAESHGLLAGFDTVLEHDDFGIGAFIMQCDGVHDEIIRARVETWRRHADEFGVYNGLVVPLFDTSGGAGKLPGVWPQAWPHVYCGYAGGLGPDNVVAQLDTIMTVTDDQRFWIDMERKVRSEDDRTFDLRKVIKVLRAVEPLVEYA